MIQTYNKWKKKNKHVSVGVFSYFAGMIVIIWLHLSHHGQSIRNPSDWSLSAHDKTFLSGWEQSLPGWLRPQHLMNTIYAVFFLSFFSSLYTSQDARVISSVSSPVHIDPCPALLYILYVNLGESSTYQRSARRLMYSTPLLHTAQMNK